MTIKRWGINLGIGALSIICANYSYNMLEKSVIKEFNKSQYQICENVKKDIEREFSQIDNILRNIANSTYAKKLLKSNIDDLIKKDLALDNLENNVSNIDEWSLRLNEYLTIQTNPIFDGLYIIHPSGVCYNRTPRKKGRVGRDFTDRPGINKIVNQKYQGLILTEKLDTVGKKIPAIGLSYGHVENGNLEVITRATIHLDKFSDRFLKSLKDYDFAVVNSNNIIIADTHINHIYDNNKDDSHKSNFKIKTLLKYKNLEFSIEMVPKIDELNKTLHKFKTGNYLLFGALGSTLIAGFGIYRRRKLLETELEEHKKTEKLLAKSENKYKNLIDNIPDVIWKTDYKGNTQFISPNVIDILGYNYNEIIDMGRTWIDKIHLNDKPKLMKSFYDLINNETPLDMDFRIQKKNGDWIWINDRSLGSYEEDGIIYADGIFKDITEQKKNENERINLEQKLLRSKKMESLGILAGGVAHDLNNVLSGVVGYPDLILMDMDKEHELRNTIEEIKKSGLRATDIVQDLLTLARRGVVAREVVNMNNFVNEYINSPEHEKIMSYNPNITLKTKLEDNLLNIKGSSVHLKKTIMNLVSNAAEAQENDGEIIISTKNKCIDNLMIGYDNIPQGDYAVLNVSDKGHGISKEDLDKIFEPFYTKKVMGRSGTGLGMAVVWGTVKDHNGYIHVESKEGKGTTFELYFPTTMEGMVFKTKNKIENYMGNGERILIVDDVKEQRDIATLMLNKFGYKPTAVSSGEEAIEYLKNNSVDLLVLDMIMDPGIDGYETYKKIVEFNPGQKAIIASGFSESNKVKDAQKLGAGQYIKKPYVLETIGRVVKDELRK
jgi:PAS domain S-box-containing protein